MNEQLVAKAIEQDLDWCLKAPSLLADHPLLWQPAQLGLHQIQLASEHYVFLQQARQKKLGRYFEALARTLIQLSPHFNLLAENLVINSDTRTLGEIDLLLEDQRSGQIVHLELALKFYLQVPDCQPAHMAWIGSGLHDFLAVKLARLYQHQLQLAQFAIEQDCWPSHLPKPTRKALWIPGRLYCRADLSFNPSMALFPDTPWRLNPKALNSVWFEQNQIQPTGNQLSKAEWLNNSVSTGERYLHAQLPAQFQQADFPQPVYVLPKQWQTSAQQTINQLDTHD